MDVVNADLMFHHGLQEFQVGFAGLWDALSTAFWEKDLSNVLGYTDVWATWTQAPAYVRSPFGTHPRAIPELGYDFRVNSAQSTCFMPIDYTRSTDPLARPPQSNVGDMSWVGYDVTLSTPCGEMISETPYDYDGDGISDQIVYRPSNVTHYTRRSTLAAATPTFGTNDVIPIHGDFDGDGITDQAAIDPYQGFYYWLALLSSTGTFKSQSTWGLVDDQIAIADYEGDGADDFGVFRDGEWYVIRSSDGNGHSPVWGIAGDVAVPDDYDDDGFADLAYPSGEPRGGFASGGAARRR